MVNKKQTSKGEEEIQIINRESHEKTDSRGEMAKKKTRKTLKRKIDKRNHQMKKKEIESPSLSDGI